ncbi:MAG: hypothetical protein JSU94_15135 [Phycisphaerales bacterium]|nr:MAG: hypothetical protein JSU94_15135 [Phycisphaerales bacterium]
MNKNKPLRAYAAMVLAAAAALGSGTCPAESSGDCVNKLADPNGNTMLYADTSRGRPFSKDPEVVNFKGRYYMYYSIPPHKERRLGTAWAIGIARSDDLNTWKRIGEVLPAAECEKKGLAALAAIVLDGNVHLFYQTYGNGPKDAICHAKPKARLASPVSTIPDADNCRAVLCLAFSSS